MAAGALAFAPYHLDLGTKILRRGDTIVELPPRQVELLVVLASNPGTLVTKDALIKAAWGDVAVSDNTLAQAITHLRSALDANAPYRYIATTRGYGYRFVATVERIEPAAVEVDLDAMLDPFRGFMNGRAALESLARDQVAAARAVFERLVRLQPRNARFRIGLATAHAFWFDTTRVDRAPDTDALRAAVAEAREGCQLNPANGEAFATLGFVLARTGATSDAMAAHARSVALDPSNWRHHLRYGYTGWGEDRLTGARHTLALVPGMCMARFLAATVHVARGALDEAEREVDAGRQAMAQVAGGGERFAAIGLHWVKGMLCQSRGAYAEALEAYELERADEGRGHMYGREMAANNLAAIGSVHLECGDRADARTVFDAALTRVPDHPLSLGGLAILDPGDVVWPVPWGARFDQAVGNATRLVWRGEVDRAAALVLNALAAEPPGPSGWRIPIEPLLRVQQHPEAWAAVLALLRNRAM